MHRLSGKFQPIPPQADICAFVSTSLAPGHHGPDRSRDFVGERNRRNLGRSPRQQGRKPGPMFGAMDLGVTDDRKRAGHEQAAQIQHQTQKSPAAIVRSGLPPKADSSRTSRHVRMVPCSDIAGPAAFLSTIRHVELCFCSSRALALTMGAKAERKRRFIPAAPVGHRPQPLTLGRSSRVPRLARGRRGHRPRARRPSRNG
jgi:hypothetical protein